MTDREIWNQEWRYKIYFAASNDYMAFFYELSRKNGYLTDNVLFVIEHRLMEE